MPHSFTVFDVIGYVASVIGVIVAARACIHYIKAVKTRTVAWSWVDTLSVALAVILLAGGVVSSQYRDSSQAQAFSPAASQTATLTPPPIPTTTTVPTPTSTPRPMPTATPIPIGTILYQADWSQGLDGWQRNPPGNAHWSVQNQALVNDGTDDNSTHNWPSIVDPFIVTQTADYAVETTMTMTTAGANAQCFDIGSVRGTMLANGTWQSYIATYCTPKGLHIGVVNGANTSDLKTIPFSPGNTPHVYRFQAIGSTLSLYVDGQFMMSVSDATFPRGGRTALNTYNTGVIVSGYDILYE